MTENDFLSMLETFDQYHILEHYRSLTSHQKQAFLEFNHGLDFPLVFRLFKQFSTADVSRAKEISISPAEVICIPQNAAETPDVEDARLMGESVIRKQKVTVLIVAGGQGSRLGFEGPKGTFPLSPLKGKTLFQLLAEQVKAISVRFSVTIPLLIMTSSDNHEDTIKFFKSNGFFGLPPGSVHFFSQALLPALSPEGDLILRDEVHLFTSPDGHGGSLKALSDSGILSKLISAGYEELFYCQVDNPLVKIADPVFLGYHSRAKADISTKVVRREDVSEKVGVYVNTEGKDRIIEYSDIDEKYMTALDEEGNIVYWAGNTAIHIFSLSFIKDLNRGGFALPHHCAKKSAYVVSSDWEPATIDVWKFETFVFDALPFAKSACCMEINREDEFAPVKNKDGRDSPQTAREAILSLHRRWLEKAGVTVPDDVRVEISPLFALGPRDVAAKLKGRKITIDSDLYLE
ncbi:MAG: UTP--glucose-1-phosphate uridylyltransferase [Syntrophorhabdaceae bacterium]